VILVSDHDSNDATFLVFLDLFLPSFSSMGYTIQLLIEHMLTALLKFFGRNYRQKSNFWFSYSCRTYLRHSVIFCFHILLVIIMQFAKGNHNSIMHPSFPLRLKSARFTTSSRSRVVERRILPLLNSGRLNFCSRSEKLSATSRR